MPTYDYQCSECGHTFEETLKIADRNAPCETPCQQDIPQTKHMSIKCNGEVTQVMHAPYFGYDNIKTRHSQNNKEPTWFKERMEGIKKSKRFPNNTMP